MNIFTQYRVKWQVCEFNTNHVISEGITKIFLSENQLNIKNIIDVLCNVKFIKNQLISKKTKINLISINKVNKKIVSNLETDLTKIFANKL